MVGAPLYDQRNGEMVFRPGPVFTQLLLADEINRTPPKTQAALLEAMGEGQVSVDGESRRLPQPFIVLATDNPIEYEGTYELPEAQLDRFLMRLRLGYLTASDETDMLRRRVDRATEEVALTPVTDAAGLLAMRESLEGVEIGDDLLDYVIAIVDRDPQGPADPGRRLARAAAWPWSSWPAARRCCTSATTWCPTTSSRSRSRPWRTGSRCAPSCGCARSRPTTSCPACWRASPRREPTPRGRRGAGGAAARAARRR